MQFEEEIADLEGKPALTDDECIILNHIAGKLQPYNSEFHKYHCRLVDYIDVEVELQVQQRIFHNQGRRMMNFFKRMTKLRSQKDCHTTAKKQQRRPSISVCMIPGLQLITSRMQIID